MGELILKRDPPFCIPYCGSCRVPVERFSIMDMTDPHYLTIYCECHGKATYVKVPFREVFKRQAVLVFNVPGFNNHLNMVGLKNG